MSDLPSPRHVRADVARRPIEEVRPWARSIQQRVPNREMPPWHLDKTVGIRQYKNDLSLSDDEIDTIVTWVDAGAPQGNPADMPPPLTFRPEDRLVHRQAGSDVTIDKEHRRCTRMVRTGGSTSSPTPG